jgi:hypothetical protein
MKILFSLAFAFAACESRPVPRLEVDPASHHTLSAGMTDGSEDEPAQGPMPAELIEVEPDPVPPLAPDEVASSFREILTQHDAVSIHDLPPEAATAAAALLQPSVTPDEPNPDLIAAVKSAYAEFDERVVAEPDLTEDEIVELKASMLGEGVVQAKLVNP